MTITKSAISLFFVNLQLGFVFVVLKLVQKKKIETIGVRLAVSACSFLFGSSIEFGFFFYCGLIYTDLPTCRIDGADFRKTSMSAHSSPFSECKTVLLYGVPIVDLQISRHDADEHDQLPSLKC